MKDWLVALGVAVGLFTPPLVLIGYPILANREDLIWMVGVGIVVGWVALAVFVLLCLRGEEAVQEAKDKRRREEFEGAMQR